MTLGPWGKAGRGGAPQGLVWGLQPAWGADLGWHVVSLLCVASQALRRPCQDPLADMIDRWLLLGRAPLVGDRALVPLSEEYPHVTCRHSRARTQSRPSVPTELGVSMVPGCGGEAGAQRGLSHVFIHRWQ